MERGSHVVVLLAFFAAVIFCSPVSFAAQGSSASPPPLRVVVVSGSNYEMGVQYGEQAADLIDLMRGEVWNILDSQVLNSAGTGPLGRSVILQDIQVWTYYLEKYDPKLKDWLLGISDGCANKGIQVSYQDLVAIMVYPQELWARPGAPYPAETGVTAFVPGRGSSLLAKGRTDTRPVSSCTSFAATGNATGGVPMVSITGGATLDTPQYVIVVAFPTDGQQFVSLAEAGRVAANFGANSQFGWTMPAAVTTPWPAGGCPSSWGVTSEVYFHYLQQYCKSPQDAVNYLNNTPKGGVTGLFVFADNSGNVFIDECGSCGCVIRKPGETGENKAFVATTNDYNGPTMVGYNLGAAYFPDTFVRYATIFQELSSAPAGTIGRDFAKAAWLSDNWYDATTNTWNTTSVPVADDPSNPYICNVPGNLCEGGEYEMISFPAQKTVYLEYGDPQGTATPYYWPSANYSLPSYMSPSAYNWPNAPTPTGEYTKWQLSDSPQDMANAASAYALEKIQAAQQQCSSPKPSTSCSLLSQANSAYQNGLTEQATAQATSDINAQMALWGQAYTDYVTAQLYAQMVSE